MQPAALYWLRNSFFDSHTGKSCLKQYRSETLRLRILQAIADAHPTQRASRGGSSHRYVFVLVEAGNKLEA